MLELLGDRFVVIQKIRDDSTQNGVRFCLKSSMQVPGMTRSGPGTTKGTEY